VRRNKNSSSSHFAEKQRLDWTGLLRERRELIATTAVVQDISVLHPRTKQVFTGTTTTVD
jgi:hypothetical protein